MVTAAYSAQATARANEPWYFVTIDGLGVYAAAALHLYRLSTWTPTGSYTDASYFLPLLTEPPAWTHDTLNQADSSSDAGSCVFTLLDNASEQLGAFFSYMRGGVSAQTGGEYETIATEDVDRSETNITTNSAAAAFTAGDIVWMNSEAMRVTASAANNIDVARGVLGTTASRHITGDAIRRAPLNPRGLIVRVYRSFKGLAAADEALRWSGRIRDVRQTPDGLGWQVTCESLLMSLDVEVMRTQGLFRVHERIADMVHTLHFSLASPGSDYSREYEGFADTQQHIYVGCSEFPGCLLVQKSSAAQYPDAVRTTRFQASSLGIGDYDEWATGDMGSEATMYEVAPTNTRLSYTRFGQIIAGPTLVPSAHPFHIALNWITSTIGSGTNGSWDALPEGWGAEIPESLVDVDSFTVSAQRFPVKVPNLLYGIKPGGFALRRHLEDELLGPYNHQIVQRDGVLSLVRYAQRPSWDTSGAVNLSHASILEDSIPVNNPDLGEEVESVHIQAGYNWRTEKFGSVLRIAQRPKQAVALHGGRVVKFDLYGPEQGISRTALEPIFLGYLERNRQPPPVLQVVVSDNFEHQIQVGDTVTVTSDFLMDMSTGVRGVTTHRYIVIGADYGEARYTLRLANANGRIRIANIAPALIKAAGGIAPTYNVQSAAFTESGVYTGISNDTDWFTAGDYVQLLNGDSLVVRSADSDGAGTRITVASKTATSITLSAAFFVAPSTGDIITFLEYGQTGSTTTAAMKRFAFYATSGRIGTSNDAPYVYVE